MKTQWLTTEVTPSGFDAAVGLMAGGGCAAIALVNAVYGYWWFAFVFAVVSYGPLRASWRYLRSGRRAIPSPDGHPESK
jgi:hypothetical protein